MVNEQQLTFKTIFSYQNLFQTFKLIIFSIIIDIDSMHNSQMNLRETANFALDKKITFGSFTESIRENTQINKTLKNPPQYTLKITESNYHQNTAENRPKWTEGDTSEIQTLKRIDLNKNSQICHAKPQISKKNIKIQGSCSTNTALKTGSEVLNLLVPNVISEEQLDPSSHLQNNNLSKNSIDEINIKSVSSNEDNLANSAIDIILEPNLQSRGYKPKQYIRVLTIRKQVSISYAPIYSEASNLKKGKNFTKFRQDNQGKMNQLSSISICSNPPFAQNEELKDCLVNSTENFVKLHQINLFVQRKKIRIQRSDQLLKANDRLLTGNLVLKEQLEKTKKRQEQKILQYQNQIKKLKNELALEKEAKNQILIQRQMKESIIKSIKSLNQQYLRENNQLRQKVKNQLKNIHELKYQLCLKLQKHENKTNQHQHTQPYMGNAHKASSKSIYVPMPTITSYPSAYQMTQREDANMKKKHVTVLDAHYEGVSIRNFQEKKTKQGRANNISSQLIRNPSQKKAPKMDLIVQSTLAKVDKNSASQKTIGIKRNNISQQNLHKNLVTVSKNQASDNSAIMRLGDDHHQGKSVSSYSNLSVKSLSQKVGFISKPVTPTNKGYIIDYVNVSSNQNDNSASRNDKYHHKKANK